MDTLLGLFNIKDLLKRIIYPIIIRTDPEAFGIIQFIRFSAKEVKPSDRILDAGAGSCKYEKYFSHAKYESTDFENVFQKNTINKHDFVCDLHSIPKPDNSYDIILCTQVLEHVEYPQKVINEFFRILKYKGKLFLTVPQGYGLHGEPYNFYNFAKYGLESLFKNSGFEIVFIKPRGGIFWYIGKLIKIFPNYILKQYISNECTQMFKKLIIILLFPFFLICSFFIPFILFYLDNIDRKKTWTLGYACYCVKKNV